MCMVYIQAVSVYVYCVYSGYEYVCVWCTFRLVCMCMVYIQAMSVYMYCVYSGFECVWCTFRL